MPQNPWLVAGNWKRAGGEAERRFRLRDLRKGAVVGWLAMEAPRALSYGGGDGAMVAPGGLVE